MSTSISRPSSSLDSESWPNPSLPARWSAIHSFHQGPKSSLRPSLVSMAQTSCSARSAPSRTR
eukprot:8440142-Alexandrium_andersonii.AAC.1